MNPPETNFHRVAIEGIRPQVDGGRFPIKRIVGDEVVVEADVFADGHEEILAVLQYQHCSAAESTKDTKSNNWQELPFEAQGNDHWRAAFRVEKLGCYLYRIVGWVDRFRTWRHDLQKRFEAGQNLQVDLQIGADLVQATVARASGADAQRLN
jgi:starch synthase (maltosyl-transferring)